MRRTGTPHDLDLARAGIALRRRTGGPDAGWHLKGALVDGGRTELHWPLGETPDLPAHVLEAWRSGRTQPLLPLARIENERTAYALRDGRRRGRSPSSSTTTCTRPICARATVRTWREWEIELSAAAPVDVDGFFAEVERAVRAAGARDAASASKLARALGR